MYDLYLSFYPESKNFAFYGRSSDLLNFFKPSHSDSCRNSGVFRKSLIELTATGIVQDLHSIPF